MKSIKNGNGSRYRSSNFKTSESGSSKDLVGLKGNYPYPKATPQLRGCFLGVGFLGVRSAGFAVFFLSNWFREGSFMFFSTLDRDSGSGVLLDQNPKRRSESMHGIENSRPPQKKQTQKLVGRQKRLLHQTAFAPKKLLLLHQTHLQQKTFYIH